MSLADLFFLASVLFVLLLSSAIALSLIRRQPDAARRFARLLVLFVATYAVVLVTLALALPRRIYAPAQRRCFDDWCVTALNANMASTPPPNLPCRLNPGHHAWIATLEISSMAKRVRQRAPGTRAELEDNRGTRYPPCAEPDPSFSAEIGPGESFHLSMPFQLPEGVKPEGLVIHHGEFPNIVILGADQSLLHAPALQRVALATTP